MTNRVRQSLGNYDYDQSYYLCYNDYKAVIDALRAKEATGAIKIVASDFTIVGSGHEYNTPEYLNGLITPTGQDGDLHNDEYGYGWVEYDILTKRYGQTWGYGGHPVPVVTMTIRYNGEQDLAGRSLTVESYTDADLKQPDAQFVVVNNRSGTAGENRNINTLEFSAPQKGYLREGKNTFVVKVGTSSDNTADAGGTIMGVVRDVDVGWSKVEFEVELTETTPICPRPALETVLEAASTLGSSSSESVGATPSHIYVYRYAIDEYNPPSSLEYGPVLEKDITGRTYLHEGDFLSDEDFDIDWSGFRANVLNNSAVRQWGFPVTSVTYRVYFEPVDIAALAHDPSNDVPYVEFARTFDAVRKRAVPVAPGKDSTIIYGAKPTFRWHMTNDNYTAFAIQVKNGSRVIWNSGTQLAPPRDIYGDYQWSAPLYPGDQVASGEVFGNTSNYTWSVSMYNAKYQDDLWSDERAFRVNVYHEDAPNIAGYYGLNVAVKYFGPGSVNTDVNVLTDTLRVEAYTSPDFSGEPAGRTFVRNLANVTNAGNVVNATIVGLKSGTYYIRAFIDSDGDFKRSVWESWGYACPRSDTGTGAAYAPTAVTIGEGLATPTALVYVEDCDTDQDCLPDIWEYEEAGADKTDFLLKKGPMENAHNDYISVNPNLAAAISDLINGGSAVFLSSAASGRMPASVAALMLGVSSVEPSIKTETLAIKSLTLSDGEVKLTLGAEADDPTAGTVFITDGTVRATVIVKYADSLDGEWSSVERVIEKKIEAGTVSETLTLSLADLGLDPTKGFFKVEVK